MRISSATTCRLSAFAIATFLATAFHPSNVHALTVANCTGTAIRIEVSGTSGGKRGFHNTHASPGATGRVMASDNLVSLRLFESNLVETLRVSAPSVRGDQPYSAVRLANGQWQLVVGSAC